MHRLAWAVTAPGVVAFVLGCEGASYGLTRRLDSGREVVIASTKAVRWKSFESAEDATVARIGPHRVTVEPTQVKVDGDSVATIDEGTKRVTVFEQWDKLRILAGEVPIYETAF